MRQVADRYNLSSRLSVRDFVEWHRSLGEEAAMEVQDSSDQSEVASLRLENAELRRQLEQERMRSFGLETAIDIAERELEVDIRKKSVSKQSRQ